MSSRASSSNPTPVRPSSAHHSFSARGFPLSATVPPSPTPYQQQRRGSSSGGGGRVGIVRPSVSVPAVVGAAAASDGAGRRTVEASHSSPRLPAVPRPTSAKGAAASASTSARRPSVDANNSGGTAKTGPLISPLTGSTNTLSSSVSIGVNTDEAGAAECIAAVQRAFIDTLWRPSREVLEDCRDRDLWGVLKPLEVHLRCTVVEGYFGPLRALLTDDEASYRAHLVALEEEKRLLLEALEGHLRLVAMPTFHALTEGAAQIEGVRREIRAICRLR